jgi:hypothetical protein
MARSIRDRLEDEIRREDARGARRLRTSREGAGGSAQAFGPIRQAAEEIREELQSVPSVEFAINPESVWISLADRDLTFSYDPQSGHFLGEEQAHAWYDGEGYSESYRWASAEACIEGMIRLCARYARMARVLASPAWTRPKGG